MAINETQQGLVQDAASTGNQDLCPVGGQTNETPDVEAGKQTADAGHRSLPDPQTTPSFGVGSAETTTDLLEELRAKYPDAPPIHDLANLFPFPSRTELDEIVEDIRKHGLHNKILLVGEAILDGRTRYFACREAGVEPQFEQWDGNGSLVEEVVSLNLIRRHLNESQRSLVAARLIPGFQQVIAESKNVAEPKGNGANLPRTKKAATARAAKAMKVSPRSVQDGDKLLHSDRADLVSRVEAGTLAVSKAVKVIQGSQKIESSNSQVSAPAAKAVKFLVSAQPNPNEPAGQSGLPPDGSHSQIYGKTPPQLRQEQFWMSWTGLQELLKQADDVMTKVPKEVFDPEIDKTVLFGDPEFDWTPVAKEEELSRVDLYGDVVDAVEKKLEWYLKDLRRKKRALRKYQEWLVEGMTQPMYMNVKKKPPVSGNTVEDTAPPEPVEIGGA